MCDFGLTAAGTEEEWILTIAREGEAVGITRISFVDIYNCLIWRYRKIYLLT